MDQLPYSLTINDSVPSAYLILARIRLMEHGEATPVGWPPSDEIVSWCDETFGRDNWRFSPKLFNSSQGVSFADGISRTYYFKSEIDLITFKLRFG